MSRRPVAQAQPHHPDARSAGWPADSAPPAAFLRAGPQPPDEPVGARADGPPRQGEPEPGRTGVFTGERPDVEWADETETEQVFWGSSGWVDDEPRRPSAANLRKGTGAPSRRAPGLGGVLERWDPGITGARALAVAGLIAALATGVLLWASRPRPQQVPLVSAVPESSDAPVGRSGPASAEPPAAPSAGEPLVVHVTGDVRHPGVVTLPPGSRVTDAVKAAGGLRKNGRTGALNLARKLVDGEQINVGSDAPDLPVALAPPSAPGVSAPVVDLNTATLEQLQELPGVGPVLARRILDHRTEHGPFRSVDQLQDVTGIGARRFADLKDKVHVTPP